MTAQELTALLVGVYTRLRREKLTDSAARREASGYLASLRELTRKAGDRAARKGEKVLVKVEMAYVPGACTEAELERLTPDFRPWQEQQQKAQGGHISPEDVELLEVNAHARARRGEVREKTASAEAYVLKAIRYGLTLTPVSGALSWGDYRRAVAEEDLRRGDRITLFDGEQDETAPLTGPVITFLHGIPSPGSTPEDEDAPPWPITYLGQVTGYYVPKGWKKPEGEAFAGMLERLRTAVERDE